MADVIDANEGAGGSGCNPTKVEAQADEADEDDDDNNNEEAGE